MNTVRIIQAVTDIEHNAAALKWLEEYGLQLDGRSKEHLTISVTLHFAGSCPGSREAQGILANFARLNIAEIVAKSINNCRNTIALAKSAIAEEAAKDTQP